jgi:TonB family protein
MKNLFLILLSLIFLSSVVPGQTRLLYSGDHTFTAVFKDNTGAVIPGLPLHYKRGDLTDADITDINGEIAPRFAAGDYEITIDKMDPWFFRAFIRVGNDALPPNPLEFILDTDRLFPRDATLPPVKKSATPQYPPAARAVRAFGEVVVLVKIDKAGAVVSEEAIMGHPLLKAASRAAARQFLFEASEKDGERTVKLTFVFVPLGSDDKKKDVKRYENPYRILVYGPPEILNISLTTTRDR